MTVTTINKNYTPSKLLYFATNLNLKPTNVEGEESSLLTNYHNQFNLADCTIKLGRMDEPNTSRAPMEEIPIAELKTYYKRLAKPFKLRDCSVKLNRIKTIWTRDELKLISRFDRGRSIFYVRES